MVGGLRSWRLDRGKLVSGESTVANYYLLKTEPTEYSFADLMKVRETEWDGVSNPTAGKNLREMKPGARLNLYETGDMRRAVGTATGVSMDAEDPYEPVVKIKAAEARGKRG